MKNKFFAASLITLTILSITSCGSLERSRSFSNRLICSDYSDDPISELNVNLVHNMREGYKNNQHLAIEKELGIIDAVGVEFDLETLKNYIFDIENEAKKIKKDLKAERLGVRIYFARYPEVETWKEIYVADLGGFLGNPNTEANEKMHTVVFIPTITKEDGDVVDFNPTDPDTFEKGIIPEGRYAPSSTQTLMGLSTVGSQAAARSVQTRNQSAQNHGGVIR